MARIISGGGRAARQRELARQRRLEARLERAAARAIGKELDRASRRAAAAVRDGQGEAGVSVALSDHEERIARILDREYRRTMDSFGRDLQRENRGLVVHMPFTKQAEALFDQLVIDWLAQWSSQKVVRIFEGTRSSIMDALASAWEEGVGLEEQARRIRDRTGGLIARRRSFVIARTEVHSAANAANALQMEALHQETGEEFEQEWLSGQDERVRPSHEAADGQVRPRGDSFDVGGHLLAYPGDPAGPPEEVIQCRCALAIVEP